MINMNNAKFVTNFLLYTTTCKRIDSRDMANSIFILKLSWSMQVMQQTFFKPTHTNLMLRISMTSAVSVENNLGSFTICAITLMFYMNYAY